VDLRAALRAANGMLALQLWRVVTQQQQQPAGQAATAASG